MCCCRTRLGAAVWMSIVALAVAQPARGVNKTYVGPATGANARWNEPLNWSTTGLPMPADVAKIVSADSAPRDVAFDVTTTVGELQIGNTGLGTNTLTQTAAFNLTAGTVLVAGNANEKGAFTQSAGNNRYTTSLGLGFGTNGSGTYNLSGGAIAGFVGGGVAVGFGGNGQFNHTGGSVSVGESPGGQGDLYVGAAPAGIGTYTLNGAGATLTVLGAEYIGIQGTATFTHAAGTHVVGTPGDLDGIYVAHDPGSNGTYALSGAGSLTSHAGIVVGGNHLAPGGTGTLNVSGGTLTAPFVRIWDTTISTINFSGGTLNVGSVEVGNAPAKFNWTAGTLNLTGAGGLLVGTGGLSGPSLTVNSAKTLNVTGAVTVNAGATFNVAAGTHSAGTTTVAGTLAGGGNLVALVIANSGGTIAPGNAGPGPLSLGGLRLNAGAKLTMDPGDRIDVTFANTLNLAGPTDIILTGQSTTGPLIDYAGALSGAFGNLRLVGVGGTGSEYSLRHNVANTSVDVVARRVGTVAPAWASGQTAPGTGGGTFGNSVAALSPTGVMAVTTTLTGTSDGSVGGLFRKDGNALTAILRGTQPAPGPDGGVFGGFDAPAINANGRVAFRPFITGTLDNSFEGIFRTNGAAIETVARGNRDNFAGEFGEPFINASGQVAFYARQTSGYSIFVNTGSSTTALARDDRPAPNGGTFDITGLGRPSINDAGQVAFQARYTGSGNANDSQSIYRSDAVFAPLVVIARGDQGAPGGGTFSSQMTLSEDGMNNAGEVAFSAEMLGGTYGVFRGAGGPLTAIARNAEAAPGGGAFGGVMSSFGIGESGQVGFKSALTGSAGDGATAGLFRGDGVNPRVSIARHNQAAPGPGAGTFRTDGFAVPTMLGGGQVVFQASLQGTTGGAANDKGIYLGDGPELIVVVRKGQLLNGKTITDVSFNGSRAVNDFGQVAYKATLDGSETAQVLFTPVLHWRTATGGSWNANANWTVGLSPAHVHEVVIDPATALMVTGPATPRTIKSLAIGDNAGGPAATLQLTSPNAALKTSVLAVDVAGGSKLDLKDGKLIVAGGNAAAVRGLILSGYHGGAWDGGGIVTTAAGGASAVGYARAEDVGLAGGLFGGVAVTAGDVLLVSTLAGDATLDRVVDFNDLVRLAQNYNVADGSRTWSTGDFTYDGNTDFTDLVRLAQNYNAALPTGPIDGATGEFEAEFARAMARVPEPGSAAGLIAGVACLWIRRKSRQILQ